MVELASSWWNRLCRPRIHFVVIVGVLIRPLHGRRGGGGAGGGFCIVSDGLRKEEGENKPRLSSRFVFGTYYAGLPLPGSPLAFLTPHFLCRVGITRPHPSGKGRGR